MPLALLFPAGAQATSEVPLVMAVPVVSGLSNSSASRPMPVGVVINGRPIDEPGLIVLRQGQLFVRHDLPDQWGLRLPDAQLRIMVDGAEFASLDGFPGLSAQLDSAGATLVIDAAPALFQTTHMGGKPRQLPVTDSVATQFLGYDLSLSQWDGEWSASAFFDGGLSGDWGVIGSTALVQQGMGRRSFTRLESNFVRDSPDQRLRLTLGDTITRGGDWNQPVRFAGVRLGTDFSLTPNDITYAIPRLAGSSTLPSVVELAAASSRQSLTTQPGDFTIDYQPVFTGAGEVTMTIRDPSGVARTVTQSFYTSPRLLREGLDDFSLEAGFLRRNFGERSFSYGAPFVAGFWRHGLADGLTLGGRLEASGHVQMGGIALGAIVSDWGEISLSAAASQSGRGTGFMWRAQVQRVTPDYSVTASYQEEGAAFAQVGDGDPMFEKRREFIIAGSVALGRWGSINANYIENDVGDVSRFSTGSLSYAANLGPTWLTVGARQTRFSDNRDNRLFGSLTVPFGARTNAGLFVDGKRISASFSGTPPPDKGLGYRFLVSREQEDRMLMEGGVTWRTAAGDIDLSATRMGSSEGVRLQARGALLRVGGKIVAVPQLDYAFAVVDVTADQEVSVLFENRPVARPAGNGRLAVITGLQPYAPNRIAIDLDSLPIDTAVTSAEQIAVPGYRRAVRISFGGRSAYPVTLHLVDERGAPIPAGLTVDSGEPDAGVTGHDGEVFLTDAHEGQAIFISGQDAVCRAVVPALPNLSLSAKLAPVPCVSWQEGK